MGENNGEIAISKRTRSPHFLVKPVTAFVCWSCHSYHLSFFPSLSLSLSYLISKFRRDSLFPTPFYPLDSFLGSSGGYYVDCLCRVLDDKVAQLFCLRGQTRLSASTFSAHLDHVRRRNDCRRWSGQCLATCFTKVIHAAWIGTPLLIEWRLTEATVVSRNGARGKRDAGFHGQASFLSCVINLVNTSEC